MTKALEILEDRWILCIESADSSIDPVIGIQRLLTKSGHTPFFDKTLNDLNIDVRRIYGFVKNSGADAWIVLAGFT